MAAHYVRVDENNYVCGVAFSDGPPDMEGAIYHEVAEQPSAAYLGPFKTLFIDGQFHQTDELWFKPTYGQQRAANYPPIGDQLDMFWHAMNSGQMPKIQPFYDQIKSVKEQYPKSMA